MMREFFTSFVLISSIHLTGFGVSIFLRLKLDFTQKKTDRTTLKKYDVVVVLVVTTFVSFSVPLTSFSFLTKRNSFRHSNVMSRLLCPCPKRRRRRFSLVGTLIDGFLFRRSQNHPQESRYEG